MIVRQSMINEGGGGVTLTPKRPNGIREIENPIEGGRKACTRCGEEKPVSEFYRKSATDDRPRPACKDCTRKRNKRWRENNRERHNANARAANAREYNKTKRLKIRFGITIVDYWAMLDAQGYMCAICADALEPLDEAWRSRPQIDHCHETDEVRMILCGSCNRTLGQARESAEILRRASEYIAAWDAELGVSA